MKSRENYENKKQGKDYIIKEAEMLVSNYISTLEQKKKNKNISNKKINQKYIKLKNYAYIISLIVFIESLVILIK